MQVTADHMKEESNILKKTCVRNKIRIKNAIDEEDIDPRDSDRKKKMANDTFEKLVERDSHQEMASLNRKSEKGQSVLLPVHAHFVFSRRPLTRPHEGQQVRGKGVKHPTQKGKLLSLMRTSAFNDQTVASVPPMEIKLLNHFSILSDLSIVNENVSG